MSNELVDFLNNKVSHQVWVYLRKNYDENFNDTDFKMFDKYACFYDIPYKVMNVVIYSGMDIYHMDSSKLVDNINDICRLLHKIK